jgi:lipooligosaccharide transport system permease protein
MLLSMWALLAWPAAILAAASFSAMAICLTTIARKVQDFDLVMGLLMTPMFLFSGIFVPVARFPEPVQWALMVTPLYHAVQLLRQLTTGELSIAIAGHVAYLVIAGVAAFYVAMHRLERTLIK